MKKRRLLFIGGYPNPVDKYLRVFFQNLIYAIADQGVECHVVSPVSVTHYGTKVREIPEKIIEITGNHHKVYVYYPKYISLSSKNLKIFNTGILTEKLFRLAAYSVVRKIDHPFDAVYGHFFLTGGLAAVYVGNRLHIPSFVAYGECDYESQVKQGYRELKQKDICGLAGIISVSSKNSKELIDTGLFGQIPVIMCPNAVDNSVFFKKDKTESRKRFGWPCEAFIVGFVGGFIYRKGPIRVLDACNRVDDVYMVFAGNGEEKPAGEKVLFAGPLIHDEICDFLNAVDVFVLPTLAEGCCNAVLEAMAAGSAIISSKLPFNFDILNDKNALMVAPLNISEIESAVRKLKNDKQFRNNIANMALESALEFTIEKRAEKILRFIYGEKETD